MYTVFFFASGTLLDLIIPSSRSETQLILKILRTFGPYMKIKLYGLNYTILKEDKPMYMYSNSIITSKLGLLYYLGNVPSSMSV